MPLNQDPAFLCQHQRLQALLDSLPKSRLTFRKLFQRPAEESLEVQQETARDRLAAEHNAAHEVIRKRLLQSAEKTSRLFLDSLLSAEEAKNNLMDDVRSFHELLVRYLKLFCRESRINFFCSRSLESLLSSARDSEPPGTGILDVGSSTDI